jgi:hypothetical protein
MASHEKIRINGVDLADTTPPREILSFIAQTVLRKDLEYWSQDALHNLVEGVLEFSQDTLVVLRDDLKARDRKDEAAKYSFCIRAIGNSLKYLGNMKKLGKMSIAKQSIQQLYNMVLANEGLGDLPGFGVTNRYGDRPVGNPERSGFSSH